MREGLRGGDAKFVSTFLLVFSKICPLNFYFKSVVARTEIPSNSVESSCVRDMYRRFPFISTAKTRSALRDFRLTTQEIRALLPVFGYSRRCTFRNGYVFEAIEATCIVLIRLATPCRLSDLEPFFGRHSSALSEIFWECLEKFVHDQMHLVTTFKTTVLRSRSPS
jgi:hypothetical protein